MPSSFSPSLRLELIAPGEQAGTWGTTTNTNLGTLIESSVAGYQTISVIAADQALTIADGAADQSRSAMLRFTTTTGAAFNVYAPPVSKQYTVFNDSAHAATLFNSTSPGNTTASGAGVTIPAGRVMTVWSDGTAVRVQNSHLTANLVGDVTGNVTGNASTATALQTARTIGGVSFNGTANINLPGVNIAGNQDTTGNAATATALQTARLIGGVSFNGSADINLPGVNTAGNQSTTGNAATATTLQTARTINGVSFNGSANITLPTVNTSGDQTIAGVKTFSSTITGAVSGNAGTATALQTARTINGVSFNGTANITLATVNTTGDQSVAGNKTFSGTTGIGANWTVFQSGTDLVFAYNGTRRFKVSSTGDMTVSGNVTAYGTV
jgi:hypothetical protein